MSEKNLAPIIREVIKRGYNISPEALDSLSKAEDPRGLLDQVLKRADEKGQFLLTKEMFEAEGDVAKKVEETLGVDEAEESQVRVLMDIKIKPTIGLEEDFLTYFKSRLDKLERLLKKRADTWGAIQLRDLSRASISGPIKVVGMVSSKREGPRSLILNMEDRSASTTVIVPSSNPSLFDKGERVLLDEVICVEGTYRANQIIAKDIIWPDIAERRRVGSYQEKALYAILTSDLHLGSKIFLQDAWKRFLDWLNGGLDMGINPNVKYLVIAGDIVDGIGVYPNQEKELAITSVSEQYRVASEMLRQIPKHIEIIIIPGNHDAVRQALPQPPIPKDIAKDLYEMKNVHMLSNPSLVELHGVKLLLYHGNSFDDIVRTHKGMSYKQPSAIMERLLQSRHLAPIYGESSPIAPEHDDKMVVESDDFDVFHAGHVHVCDHRIYRGRPLVDSGTWQLETEYQRRMGISPTPGLVPVLDLYSLNVFVLDFVSS